MATIARALQQVAIAVACAVAGAGLHGTAWAQVPSAPAEALVKDLREEIARVDVTVKDMYNRQETRPMPITIYRPAGAGPYPVVVYNHGRAVSGKRAAQGRSRPEEFARYFVGKGFVVLAPTRIGYWQTYGDFDPEYSGNCGAPRVEPMSVAASDQVLAAMAFAKTLPYADTSRWLVAGVSVGGLAAVATVGRNPPGLAGGINFSGGTGGDPEHNPGKPCNPGQLERYWAELAGSAKAPMLWFYWANDKYWGAEIPTRWYKAWTGGGANAEFRSFDATGKDGHQGILTDAAHWRPELDAFLARLGFTQGASAPGK